MDLNTTSSRGTLDGVRTEHFQGHTGGFFSVESSHGYASKLTANGAVSQIAVLQHTNMLDVCGQLRTDQGQNVVLGVGSGKVGYVQIRVDVGLPCRAGDGNLDALAVELQSIEAFGCAIGTLVRVKVHKPESHGNPAGLVPHDLERLNSAVGAKQGAEVLLRNVCLEVIHDQVRLVHLLVRMTKIPRPES